MFSLRDLKAYLSIFIVFGSSIFFTVQSDAYVLTGPHILELMTKKMGGPAGLYVEQKNILYSEDRNILPLEEKIEVRETLIYRFPEDFRSDITSEQSSKIHVVSPGGALTVVGDKITSTKESLLDRYKDILLYRNRGLIQDCLVNLGIDVSVSSLGRFQDTILLIIGAKYPDESVSQVWVDKKTFLPLRWIIKGPLDENGNPGKSLEFRYLKWKKTERTWYPMRIEFFKNDRLVRKIEVDRLRLNPVVSENFFDINYLKSRYPLIVDETADKKEFDDIDEVKKTIDDFKKLFE